MKGRRLSAVQEYGLQILYITDARLKKEDFEERLKIALVGFDPPHFLPRVFPKISEPEKVRKAKVEDQEVVEALSPDEDLSDTEGTWRFTSDVTQEEAEEIMRSFGTVGKIDAASFSTWEDADDWDNDEVIHARP